MSSSTRIFFAKLIPVAIFSLFLFLLTNRIMPTHGEIIGWNDYPYFFPGSSFNPYSTWSDLALGDSSLASMFGIPLTGYIPALLSSIGFSHSFSSYLLNFLPVFLLCLIIFYSAKKISGNIYYAYFAGLYVILNNFILEQFLIWPGHFFWNLIGVTIGFYIMYLICEDRLDWRKSVYLILASLFVIHAFFFAIYALFVFLFLLFYLLYLRRERIFSIEWWRGGVILIGIVFVHTYWILPFIANLFYQSSINFYDGNQDAIINGIRAIASHIGLFTFYNYAGGLALKLHQGLWQYIVHFTVILVMILALIKGQFTKHRSYILFSALTYLFFSFLSLGPNAVIFGNLWRWAFSNVLGFGFFRSFTRFVIVGLIAIIFFFAACVKEWRIDERYKKHILRGAIFILLTANVIFFTGDLAGTMALYKIPQEYIDINERYFKNDPQQFAITSYPNIGYESYTWSINRSPQRYAQPLYFSAYFYSKPIIYNSFSDNLDYRNRLFQKLFAHDNNFKFYKDFDKDLSSLNIRYIVIRKDLVNILNLGAKPDYKPYQNYFRSHSQYLLREDNDHLALFENTRFAPMISAHKTLFQKVSPVYYRINLKDLENFRTISFLRSFHRGWNLYIQPNTSTTWCEEFNNVHVIDSKECRKSNQFFKLKELLFPLMDPIFVDTHVVANEYANQWTIDADYIRSNFSKNYYKSNRDGSIDVELALYFMPQYSLYIGLFFSGSTLLGCLSYLLIRRKKTA